MKQSLVSTYDPVAAGADCAACPLNGRTVVPPKSNSHPRLNIVGESPGGQEEACLEPFVGPSGWMLERNLRALGVRRDQLHITNAILCRPTFEMSDKDWKKALACCRPRLERELPTATTVAIGERALNQLCNKSKITLWRGAILKSAAPFTTLVMPTIHPAFVMRDKAAWEPVLRIDLRRALELPEWEWPRIIIEEGPEMLDGLKELLAYRLPVGTDVETDGLDPVYSGLLCLGLANLDLGVSAAYPFSPEVDELVRRVLTAPDVEKVFHNKQHDLIVLDAKGLPVDGPVFDTMDAHTVYASQLPHNLGFVASCELDADRWKTGFRVEEEGEDVKGSEKFTKADPRELRLYNAKDSIITAMLRDVAARRLNGVPRGRALYSLQSRLSDLAMRMRRRGILIDMAAVSKHREVLTKKQAEQEAAFYKAVPQYHVIRGKDVIYKRDPITKEKVQTHVYTKVYIGPYRLGIDGQHHDLKKLFFQTFRLPILRRTKKSNAPQLNDEVVQRIAFGIGYVLHPRAAAAAAALDKYREYGKLKSNWTEGLSWVARDGVVRPSWAPCRPVTGRWAVNSPNITTLPPKMRNIIVARPGCYFVSADWSQVEPRITALLSGDPTLLGWYERGENVYLNLARMLFGPATQKDSTEYKALKAVFLGRAYGGGAETLHRNMVKKGIPVQFGTVKKALDFLKDTFPEVEQFGIDQIRQAEERDGTPYVQSAFSGRQEYFHSGVVDATVARNYPIQASAADMLNEAILAVDSKLNWKTEAVVINWHDEIVTEGPDPIRLGRIIKTAMHITKTHAGRTMEFPVDLVYGRDLGNMVPLELD